MSIPMEQCCRKELKDHDPRDTILSDGIRKVLSHRPDRSTIVCESGSSVAAYSVPVLDENA